MKRIAITLKTRKFNPATYQYPFTPAARSANDPNAIADAERDCIDRFEKIHSLIHGVAFVENTQITVDDEPAQDVMDVDSSEWIAAINAAGYTIDLDGNWEEGAEITILHDDDVKVTEEAVESLRQLCEWLNHYGCGIVYGIFTAYNHDDFSAEMEVALMKEAAGLEAKLISLDNGNTYLTAGEAIPEILADGLWDEVAERMDPDTREKVHYELAPCTEEEFLARYLEIAPWDLIIG